MLIKLNHDTSLQMSRS